MNQTESSTGAGAGRSGTENSGRYTSSTSGQDRFLGLLFWAAEYQPGVLRILNPLISLIVWAVAPGLRAAVRSNLKRVTGAEVNHDKMVRRVVSNFVRFVADLGEAQHLSPEALVARATEIDGAEHYESALAMGRGLIVATAHLGSFEVGLAMTAAKSPATHVVFATDPFPRFDRLRRQLREKLGVQEARSEGGWLMWGELRDALERGEVVVLQADRVMPGQKGKPAVFCGEQAEMPTGPVRLAQLTGAPIVPVFAVRTRGKEIKLVIGEPILVGEDGDARAAQKKALQLLADAMSKQIHAYPEQWLMLHSVWGSQASGLAMKESPIIE